MFLEPFAGLLFALYLFFSIIIYLSSRGFAPPVPSKKNKGERKAREEIRKAQETRKAELDKTQGEIRKAELDKW